MKKQFYIKQEDQAQIISAYMLECGFQIGKSTYMIKIDDKTNKELCIIILVNKDNGTIMQKWGCLKNKHNEWSSSTTYKNDFISSSIVDCDTTEYDGLSCFNISDDKNIKCFLCENKPETS